jgi:O-antigen/teichoic acid export membrane protein
MESQRPEDDAAGWEAPAERRPRFRPRHAPPPTREQPILGRASDRRADPRRGAPFDPWRASEDQANPRRDAPHDSRYGGEHPYPRRDPRSFSQLPPVRRDQRQPPRPPVDPEDHRRRQLEGLSLLTSLTQRSAATSGFPVITVGFETITRPRPGAEVSPEAGRGPRVLSLLRDPALRSAIALALSAILSGVLGLVFWARAAHYDSVATVGHISAEVSAITFLALIGSLNLMTAFPRFLPEAGWNTRRMLLSSYTASALVGLIAAGIFMLTPLSSALVLDGMAGRLGFTFCVMVNSIFMFQDGALVGFGKAVWVPVENLLVAIARLGLIPVIAASAHLPVTASVLWAWAFPTVISVFVVNGFNLGPLAGRQSVYQPKLPPMKEVLNWVGIEALTTIVNASVSSFLPALVAWRLGAVQGGYIYVPWTIATMATLLLTNVFISMVREVITVPERASITIDRSLRLAAAFVVCGVIGCALLGKFILLPLGGGYGENGGSLLRWIGFSFPAIAINLLFVAVCLVKIRPGLIFIANCAVTIGTIGGLMELGHGAGIGSVGFIYCIVQWVVAAAFAIPAVKGILAIRDGRV